VYAGTLNGTGALRVRVDRDASSSVIARIVAMVEEASQTKAPTQLCIEKVEQRYSIAVVAATPAVFTIPLAFGGDLASSLLRAMTFMIVASPCAVVLATMPPLLSAIANAGRHGVLVKSAVVMERLGAVTAVALDKTGTLTEGNRVSPRYGPCGAVGWRRIGSSPWPGRPSTRASIRSPARSSKRPATGNFHCGCSNGSTTTAVGGWSWKHDGGRCARLVQVRADMDASRPALRRRTTKAPFGRRRYTLLCLIGAELLTGPVTTIGLLAQRVTQAAAERERKCRSPKLGNLELCHDVSEGGHEPKAHPFVLGTSFLLGSK
jgi:hypothetical protein